MAGLAPIINLIKNLNVENLSDAELIAGINTANEVDYLRFDPLVIATLMLKTAGSKATLKNDVLKLLALVIVRGTNFSDATIRMSDSGKSEITALINKYGIKVEPSGGKKGAANRAVNRIAMSPETITLGRVASAFPQWAALLIASSTEGSPLRKWVPYASGIPYYLAFPQCISLIPTDDTNMKNAAKEFYKRFDETINRNQDEDSKIRHQRVEMFFDIINNSPLLDNNQRRTILTSLENTYKDKDLAATINKSGGLIETIQKNAVALNAVPEISATGVNIPAPAAPVPIAPRVVTPPRPGAPPADVKFDTETLPEAAADKSRSEVGANAFVNAARAANLPTGYYDVELLRPKLSGLPWKPNHQNKVLFFDSMTPSATFYAKTAGH